MCEKEIGKMSYVLLTYEVILPCKLVEIGEGTAVAPFPLPIPAG